jgi:hypothetical protein
MSERAQQLAQQFQEASAAFAQMISDATPEQLQRIVPEEGWKVIAIAQHVAVSYRVNANWIRRVAAGEAVAATRAQIDQSNADTAEENSRVTKDEVLQRLTDYGKKAYDVISGLSDEQLHTSGSFGPDGGDPLTASQVIRYVLLHHIEEHSAHVQAALTAGS